MTLDMLQALFWSFTYFFLIIYAVKHKRYGIPLIPLALNYAWETIALFTTILFHRSIVSYLMHGAWFILDTAIVFCFFRSGLTVRKKTAFTITFVLAIFVCIYTSSKECLHIFAYYMDIFMAVEFVMFALFLNVNKGFISYCIAISKLLGDLFAWLNLYGFHLFTFSVLLLNTVYLLILLYKKSDSPLLSIKSPLSFF